MLICNQIELLRPEERGWLVVNYLHLGDFAKCSLCKLHSQ